MKIIPEWAPQDAVLLVWPHAQSDWSDNLAEIEATYLALTAHLAKTVTVILLMYDAQHLQRIEHLLPDNTQTVIVPTNDTWIRDSGPISVQDNNIIHCLDFAFDAWGGKYDCSLDTKICEQLSKNIFNTRKFHYKKINCVLEGGSIEPNGAQCLLTTRQCLLGANRNVGFAQKDYEAIFAEHFGIEKTLWLDYGNLEGDDTDSHIDMLARFCNENTIAYTACNNAYHPNFNSLNNMAVELKKLSDTQGQKFDLFELPLPSPIVENDRMLAASYANFLITNEQVMVPVYHDHADDVALRRLDDVFEGRSITPIEGRPFIMQNGVIHCASMPLFKSVENQT